MVKWLGLHTSKAGSMGLIPGWETKIPHATQCIKKKFFFKILKEKHFQPRIIHPNRLSQSNSG